MSEGTFGAKNIGLTLLDGTFGDRGLEECFEGSISYNLL